MSGRDKWVRALIVSQHGLFFVGLAALLYWLFTR